MDGERKKILSDHVRKKKRLVPPFLNMMGERYAPYSWVHQLVPEMLWIALLIKALGLRSAIEAAYNLTSRAAKFCNTTPTPHFAALSSFSILGASEQERVISSIESADLEKLRTALLPLHRLTHQHPLNFLFNETDGTKDFAMSDELGALLEELYNRESRIAVLSIATATYLGIRQEKVVLADHLMDKIINDFNAITDYPETEESKLAASSFRAGAPMLFLSISDDRKIESTNNWSSSFWGSISTYSACSTPYEIANEEIISEDSLESIIVNYRNRVKAELLSRLSHWPLDLNHVETYEVVGALLARQATLARDLAAAPPMWTSHCAPILLRAMADVFVTTVWILKDPDARAKRFIEDGLGAIKLENAHRKNALEKITDEKEKEQVKLLYEYWESWSRAQRMDQFVEVNLGSWSGLSTRKMAEEAEVLDFYNHVYQPFSAAVHSNWAHVSDKNSVHCENPGHRFHRIPTILEVGIDPYWLYLGAKYLQKTLTYFDRFIGLDAPKPNAYDWLYEQLYGEDEKCDHASS